MLLSARAAAALLVKGVLDHDVGRTGHWTTRRLAILLVVGARAALVVQHEWDDGGPCSSSMIEVIPCRPSEHCGLRE